MTLLSTARDAVSQAWSWLFSTSALPHGPHNSAIDERPDRADDEERQIRVLMSHWF